MRKKVVVFIVLLVVSVLFFTGCEAKLRIRENSSAILRVTIPNEEFVNETVTDSDINNYIGRIFSATDSVDVELKSYRQNRNGHHLRVKITPKRRLLDTYEDGFAIGSAYQVFKAFSLEHIGRANWRTGKNEIQNMMQNQMLFALDKSGNDIDYYSVARIMDKTGMRLNRAVFIKGGFYGTHVSVPGQIIAVYSASKDIEGLNTRSVVLGSGDAMIIYKSNFWPIFILVLLLCIAGIILYYLNKNRKRNKVSEESPQKKAGTLFCDKCGTPAEKVDKFCRKCGAPIKMEE